MNMAVASSTAHDTPARKSPDAGVIPGRRLAAGALKNAGIRIVDVRHERVAARARQEARLNTAEHG
jgi:hypothetical protein